MGKLTVISGNIFTSQCQTIVNTVNCVGVMGAGIALEFRLRYPEMYAQYQKLCEENKIDIGMLWLYKSGAKWVLCFPTKRHWKHPSKEEYLHKGLQKFMSTYRERGITSVAFPLLGSQHGGISQDRSLEIMKSYLIACDIDTEIFIYDATAPDDVFERFKKVFEISADADISIKTGLPLSYVRKVRKALEGPICQLNQLASVKGIGDRTLEKAFSYMQSSLDCGPGQQGLGL